MAGKFQSPIHVWYFMMHSTFSEKLHCFDNDQLSPCSPHFWDESEILVWSHQRFTKLWCRQVSCYTYQKIFWMSYIFILNASELCIYDNMMLGIWYYDVVNLWYYDIVILWYCVGTCACLYTLILCVLLWNCVWTCACYTLILPQTPDSRESCTCNIIKVNIFRLCRWVVTGERPVHLPLLRISS